MTNYLGPVILDHVQNVASLADNTLILSGYYANRISLDELRELFRAAPDNAVIISVPGGIQRGDDLTSDLRLTWRCLFDSDKIVDGWYLLARFRYAPDEFSNYYPWRVELFFLGTAGIWKEGFGTEDLEAESNDWE